MRMSVGSVDVAAGMGEKDAYEVLFVDEDA